MQSVFIFVEKNLNSLLIQISPENRQKHVEEKQVRPLLSLLLKRGKVWKGQKSPTAKGPALAD